MGKVKYVALKHYASVINCVHKTVTSYSQSTHFVLTPVGVVSDVNNIRLTK